MAEPPCASLVPSADLGSDSEDDGGGGSSGSSCRDGSAAQSEEDVAALGDEASVPMAICDAQEHEESDPAEEEAEGDDCSGTPAPAVGAHAGDGSPHFEEWMEAAGDEAAADATVGDDASRGADVSTRGVVRISKKGRGVIYQAMVIIKMIKIISRASRDLATVLEFHMVLTGLKQRVVERDGLEWNKGNGCTACEEFEGVFRAAMHAELASHGLSIEDMAPQLITVVPANYWIGERLYSPRVGLDDGLRIWRRMLEARGPVYLGSPVAVFRRLGPLELEQAWGRLRAAYIETWRRHGQGTFDCGAEERRLERLFQARQHSREQSEQVWNLMRMADEERLQRAAAREARRACGRELAAMAREERRQRRCEVAAAKAERQECARMAREEARQLAFARREARQEARERRAMLQAEREMCGQDHRGNALTEDLAELLIDRILSRWRRRFPQGDQQQRTHLRQEQRRRHEECQQRRLLQRAAAAKARQEERAQRAERERRWRGMNSSDLTMQDILGGRCGSASGRPPEVFAAA